MKERFSRLPLILAGPMLRRTEPHAVTVWLALKEAQTVTLHIYAKDTGGNLVQQLEGTRCTVRLGDHLHIVAVTARATHKDERLAWGGLYYYDLFFLPGTDMAGLPRRSPAMSVPGTAAHLDTPGILSIDPSSANPLQRLVYPGHPLPSLVIPPEDLNQFRVMHGSCRKPHGVGKEMLSALDTILEEDAHNPLNRPQQLFLTGDQIYADDVAAPLLFALIETGNFLLAGNKEEILPLVNVPATKLAPGGRTVAVRNMAMFTTTSPENHLLALAEYSTMYLFAWSDVLWPDDLPGAEDIWHAYPEVRPRPDLQERVATKYADHIERLREFKSTLPQVRRALANIATYMICDDHDVTDDWYLDGAWCQRVLDSALGRHLVRNALLAYSLFQAWGNTPDQFEEGNGRAFLDAIDTWRGDEADERTETIACLLGLSASFAGSGELQRSDQALRWHYTYAGPRFHTIVMDTRTQRIYRSPSDFPGLLSPSAIDRQVLAAARRDVDLTLIISATPVLGVGFIENIQFWSRLRVKDNYAFDREAWNLEWGTFQNFLCAVSSLQRVVVLSGDVHYAFGSSLEFWDHSTRATAKIIDYTSSPLRNEGSSTHMAMLAVGYPQLIHLLRRQDMPTVDFFAWDTVAGNRHVLKKMLNIIRARIYQLWWSVPRLIDAMRSPYEIVLPARGWPKRSFDTMPPDRSYRLRYLPDTLQRTSAQSGFPEQRPPTLPLQLKSRYARMLSAGKGSRTLHRLGFRLRRIALGGVAFIEGRLGRARSRLVRRAVAPERTSKSLPRGMHHIVRGAIKGSDLLERRLQKRRNILAEALFHREEWLRKWKAGGHIVGYANIGEIVFCWTSEKKEATQRLWWWHSSNPTCPTLASQYTDTLELPAIDAGPPLP